MRPRKNSHVFEIVLKNMFDIVEKIYKEKLYAEALERDGTILVFHLQELELLDCIEKAAEPLKSTILFKDFIKPYTKESLLEWLFANAKKALKGELEYIGERERDKVYGKK